MLDYGITGEITCEFGEVWEEIKTAGALETETAGGLRGTDTATVETTTGRSGGLGVPNELTGAVDGAGGDSRLCGQGSCEMSHPPPKARMSVTRVVMRRPRICAEARSLVRAIFCSVITFR